MEALEDRAHGTDMCREAFAEVRWECRGVREAARGQKEEQRTSGRVAPCGDKREKGFWRIRSLPEGFFYSLDSKQWTFLVSVLDLWG